MRIAVHAGQLLQPVPGGIGRYVRALLRSLPGAGVAPVAFAAGPRPPRVAADVPWIDLGAPHGSLRYESWHFLRRPVVPVEADVLHATSLAIPPSRGTPLVVTVHGLEFLRLPHTVTRHGARFHRRGLELSRKHASLVIAPSTFTAAELAREGFSPDRVQVVPLGVDAPDPRDPDEIDATVARAGATAPFVVTVGTIEPRKDLPTLVHAVELARRTHPDLELVVVGPKGWGDVEGLDRPFVQVLGAQPWRVVDALYRRAAVCCIGSRYEGFGLPAVEAMARGTPVVATTGSALDERVAGAGLLFEPGDARACADAVTRVLDDADLRGELARAGRARAAELTWPGVAEAHARAYARARTHPR